MLGTHSPRLDDKGRLILPAKFRDELANGVVLTPGQDRCIYVFSLAEFASIQEKIRQAPLASAEARAYTRVFLSQAHDEVPDKQGRVTIPATLRNFAGLSKELAVVGIGSHAEIWDATAWQTYLADKEQAFSDLTEEVIPGLF